MTRKDDGPGVPEGVPRTLQGLIDRLGASTLDRLWIFQPRIRGRKESGLLVVSRFSEDDERDRRLLFTASYAAERTGKGLTVEWSLSEEGTAPPDRLPPVMEGVLRRSGDAEHQVREVALGGDVDSIEELLGEWERGLLDPELWPVAVPVDEPEATLGDEAGSEAESVGEFESEAESEPEADAEASAVTETLTDYPV